MLNDAPQHAGDAPHIRLLSIRRFRGIKELVWRPGRGVNVLLGGHCGIVETLPASGAEPSAVARWLANQDDVGALLSRFRTAWDAVPEHNRRPEVVADRLRALLIR